jgi:hypothetical protein
MPNPYGHAIIIDRKSRLRLIPDFPKFVDGYPAGLIALGCASSVPLFFNCGPEGTYFNPRVFRRCSALWGRFCLQKSGWRLLANRDSVAREDLRGTGDDGAAQSGSAGSCSIASVLRRPWRVSSEL